MKVSISEAVAILEKFNQKVKIKAKYDRIGSLIFGLDVMDYDDKMQAAMLKLGYTQYQIGEMSTYEMAEIVEGRDMREELCAIIDVSTSSPEKWL